MNQYIQPTQPQMPNDRQQFGEFAVPQPEMNAPTPEFRAQPEPEVRPIVTPASLRQTIEHPGDIERIHTETQVRMIAMSGEYINTMRRDLLDNQLGHELNAQPADWIAQAETHANGGWVQQDQFTREGQQV